MVMKMPVKLFVVLLMRSILKKSFSHAEQLRRLTLLAHSYGDANVEEGDEIVVTEMEHHANIYLGNS